MSGSEKNGKSHISRVGAMISDSGAARHADSFIKKVNRTKVLRTTQITGNAWSARKRRMFLNWQDSQPAYDRAAAADAFSSV
jgi:hypothetical protein